MFKNVGIRILEAVLIVAVVIASLTLGIVIVTLSFFGWLPLLVTSIVLLVLGVSLWVIEKYARPASDTPILRRKIMKVTWLSVAAAGCVGVLAAAAFGLVIIFSIF